MRPQRILITGAAGNIGTMMRSRLHRSDRVLRLLDWAPLEPSSDGENVELVQSSIVDFDAMHAACADVDAIIHLGGHSRENTWEEILRINVDGTHTVLEAARIAGVPRAILASSNHAVGYRKTAEAGTDGLPADSSPRPDTYYGFSKAAVEALGSLYHSRFGMDVICVRIGSCFEHPPGARGLATWLSPDDGARLLEACLSAPAPGYRVVWGVSENTRRVYSLTEAKELGYRPLDDAERFAGELADARGLDEHVGGDFLTVPLGEPEEP